MSLVLVFVECGPGLQDSMSVLSFALREGLSQSRFGSSVIVSTVAEHVYPWAASMVEFYLSSVIGPGVHSTTFYVASKSILVTAIVMINASAQVF